MGEAKYVLFGIDADTWAADAGNVDYIRQQCEASVYCNANVLAFPVTWKNVERAGLGQYDFSFVDQVLALAEQHGLKAIPMWVGIDYAAGDPLFVPDWVRDDPETYTRITGFHYDEYKRYKEGWVDDGVEEDRLYCPSCPATLAAECAAYERLVEHIAQVDTNHNVVAISVSGEINYARALNPATWTPERDVRCQCEWCNAAYKPGVESNLAFMTGQFARYVKTLIEAGARHLDLPTYSQVCPHNLFPGWRYAEDPVAFKAIINRPNHFMVPSVTNTGDAETFTSKEMDYFKPECIPGNFVFTDGIPTGWGPCVPHLEIAPWYTILHYGGLGAIYWDPPQVSIIKPDVPYRALLRTTWGPLKALHYWLARLKSAGPDRKFWWGYAATESSAQLGEFAVSQTSSDKDYGVVFRTGEQELALTVTTLGGSTTLSLTRSGGFEGFHFERGSFDMVTGGWTKAADAQVEVSGDTATLTLDGDSGDYTQAAWRVYH